jgi:hypothetical protein
MVSTILVPLALLLAAGANLPAEEAPAAEAPQARPAPKPAQKAAPKIVAPKPFFGLAGSLVNPMGDLADLVGMGFSVGAFYEMPFGPNFAGRGTVEYAMFGDKEEGVAGLATVTSSWNHVGVIADALYYFDERARSGYLLGGVGFYSQTAKVETKSSVAYLNDSWSESETNVGVDIGGGYWFSKNLGAEAKYTSAGDADWLQLTVRWRF